eukprot:361219-Chlamydomonas_euryale.AAC.4
MPCRPPGVPAAGAAVTKQARADARIGDQSACVCVCVCVWRRWQTPVRGQSHKVGLAFLWTVQVCVAAHACVDRASEGKCSLVWTARQPADAVFRGDVPSRRHGQQGTGPHRCPPPRSTMPPSRLHTAEFFADAMRPAPPVYNAPEPAPHG